MQPHVVGRIESPTGAIVTRPAPREYSRPISGKTAAELTAMMEAVVTGGTGTNAQIPGVRVAGKTGTAETGRPGLNTVWFTAFAPADRPRVALAVVVENQHGAGGQIAAPIARAVMQALLGTSSNS
jgi:penicillin-binding protein A